MARLVREAMMVEPVFLSSNTALIDAAVQMRQYDIGDVLVTEQDRVLEVLTDRDIVVRGLAAGKDPARTTVGEIASGRLVTVAPGRPSEPGGRVDARARGTAVAGVPGRPAGRHRLPR